MCLYPRLMRNPRYRPNKSNEGIPPWADDYRKLVVPVGCGKCIECRKQKARDWQIRLYEEIKVSNGIFVTLTFNEARFEELNREIEEISGQAIQDVNIIPTLAVRRFNERWRKTEKKAIRHWLVTELGHEGTERIHLHGLLFTDKPTEFIEKKWSYGYIWVGSYVNESTINYITKYVTKVDKDHKTYVPKILCSPGIGAGYLDTFNAKQNVFQGAETREAYVTRQGLRLNMPQYYRNKLYSEEEREMLWMQKLDKEERWVLGEKISVKDGEEEYFNVLEVAREKNKRLGYGDNSKEWKKNNYTEQLKKLRKAKNDK